MQVLLDKTNCLGQETDLPQPVSSIAARDHLATRAGGQGDRSYTKFLQTNPELAWQEIGKKNNQYILKYRWALGLSAYTVDS